MLKDLTSENLIRLNIEATDWEDAVRKAAQPLIGVATLATPVEFGSEANDPVKYLFCLSARNNTEHLDALADLAERLEDQEFFKMLDQATDPKEVLDYLSK